MVSSYFFSFGLYDSNMFHSPSLMTLSLPEISLASGVLALYSIYLSNITVQQLLYCLLRVENLQLDRFCGLGLLTEPVAWLSFLTPEIIADSSRSRKFHM